MKGLPVFAAIIEAATGVGLILVPSLVGQLLLGIELTGVIVRVAGIALIVLAIACRPGPPMLGMLIYNAAVALYLACVGITGDSSGGLLWPVVIGCPVSMTISRVVLILFPVFRATLTSLKTSQSLRPDCFWLLVIRRETLPRSCAAR